VPFPTPNQSPGTRCRYPALAPPGGTTEGTPFTTVATYAQASSPTIGIGTAAAGAINIGNSSSITTIAGTLTVGGNPLGTVALKNTGTSGPTIPVLNAANTLQAAQRVNQPIVLTTTHSRFEQNLGAFTPVATPSWIAGQLLWCSFAYYGGAVIGSTAFASWTFADNVTTTGNSDRLDIEEPIAANGNVASGPRVSLNAFQQQIGTSGIDATFTGSISGTTLTVSSGAGIAAGQMLFGSGVTPLTSIGSGGGPQPGW
jgi:hypothetical protein